MKKARPLISKKDIKILINNSAFKLFKERGLLDKNKEKTAYYFCENTFNEALSKMDDKANLIPGYIEYSTGPIESDFDTHKLFKEFNEMALPILRKAHLTIETGLKILIGDLK